MQHEQDRYGWLEDIHGSKALDWVKQENARTDAELKDQAFTALQERILEVLNSEEKIPGPTQRGNYIYNFWQDAKNPRGLWRRTTVASYATDTPEWQTLLDVDALAAEEGIEWVYSGAAVHRPADERAIVELSPDGGDATQLREFDIAAGTFVPEADGGFRVETAKTWFSWFDADTLLVATPTDETDTTASSYPATVKLLRRGTALADAPTIFSVDLQHLGAMAHVDQDPEFRRLVASDVIDFFNGQDYLHTGVDLATLDSSDGFEPAFTPLPLPTHMRISFHRRWLVLYPREDYIYNPETGATAPGGSLLVVDADAFVAGTATPTVVYTPDESSALQAWVFLDDLLLLNVLKDVRSTLAAVALPTPEEAADGAAPRPVAVDASALTGADPYQMFSFSRVDRFGENPNELWLTTSGFLTPTTLYRATIEWDRAADAELADTGTADAPEATLQLTKVKTTPGFFDAEQYRVAQHFATSADGTGVPYFVVHHKDLVLDGANPTLLSGYGGFQVSRTPGYDPTTVLGWAEPTDEAGRHGVYVLANIRGGGEYGPRWHRAALKENRHRAYEDFAAVAQDLIDRGITSPERLAAAGGSNGGLLIGNMLMQYPHLFGALSCGVPLLDMRRYTQLSAGHSWIAEYGDPDVPEQWDYIRTFSPYQLADAYVQDPGRLAELPPTLFWTATSDDRVGPVQARKMAAKLLEAGAEQMRFHEVLDGGHAGASDHRARAELVARYLRFLRTRLAG